MTRENKIYNLAVKEKLMDLYIHNLEKSVDVIDSIIPIIRKFDGKVYNARLENTLKDFLTEGKEIEDKIYPHVELNCSRLRLELSFWNNRRVDGDACSFYLPEGLEEVTLAYDSSNWSEYKSREENHAYYDPDDLSTYFYIDGNYNIRIKSARIVDLILKEQKELKEQVQLLKEERKKVLEHVEKLSKIKEELDALHDSIPSAVRSIYDIKTFANFY